MRCHKCGGALPVSGRNDSTGECVCAVPKTPAERKASERQRRTESGQSRLELWAHPDDHEAIKAYAEKLAKKRRKCLRALTR